MHVQVLALKTAEEALKDAMYVNGHDRKRQRTEASVPGLDVTDDEDEASAVVSAQAQMASADFVMLTCTAEAWQGLSQASQQGQYKKS